MTQPYKPKVLDLFSGIGGFSLGLERAGMETAAFCEIDPFCRRVLAKHWPEVPCYDDVRTLTAERLAADGVGPVDVITGGFPCQDLSLAGQLAGLNGDRSGLWSEIVRLVSVLRPGHLIVENVANLLAGPSDKPGAWFGRVLGDLARERYDAVWDRIPAEALGADHERERVWLVAYPCEARLPGRLQTREDGAYAFKLREGLRFALANAKPLPREHRHIKPVLGRGAHGVPNRSHRVGALGNAVVPQIPEIIGRAIMQTVFTPPD